jgi:hypothetical protein
MDVTKFVRTLVLLVVMSLAASCGHQAYIITGALNVGRCPYPPTTQVTVKDGTGAIIASTKAECQRAQLLLSIPVPDSAFYVMEWSTYDATMGETPHQITFTKAQFLAMNSGDSSLWLEAA